MNPTVLGGQDPYKDCRAISDDDDDDGDDTSCSSTAVDDRSTVINTAEDSAVCRCQSSSEVGANESKFLEND
jgi:hypothetical protein